MDIRHDILELARFLTELSVIDYFFVIHRPSVVAYAAIIIAMEEVPGAAAAIPDFANEINNFSHLRCDCEDLLECRTRLRLLYAQGSYTRPATIPAGIRDESVSPVCVSYVYHPHQVSYDTEDY